MSVPCENCIVLAVCISKADQIFNENALFPVVGDCDILDRYIFGDPILLHDNYVKADAFWTDIVNKGLKKNADNRRTKGGL